jgi:Protein of unknown function (DUF4058)
MIESDIPAYEAKLASAVEGSNADATPNGSEAQWWSPPEAVQTLEIDLPEQDIFEVRIKDTRDGMRLVAAIELVSPGNKDRPETRQAFAMKCAAYLQTQVNLVVVDIVTSRHANFHQEVLSLVAPHAGSRDNADLYCVSYRNRKQKGKWQMAWWPFSLNVGLDLPTAPLWLSGEFSVPLDLEKGYEETCRVLRIPTVQ